MIRGTTRVRRCTALASVTNAFSTTATQPTRSDAPDSDAWNKAKPFSAIPGPTRFQLVKQFMPGGVLHNVPADEMHRYYRHTYGTLARIPGLLGKRDTLFSFDPRHYELVFRTEGVWPRRRGFEAFAYYREHVRPDVFHGMGGLVSDQGERWANMRSTVNPVLMRPKAEKSYVPVVDEVAREFVRNIHSQLDANEELPSEFKSDLSMWALESIGAIALDKQLGVMRAHRDANAEQLVQAIDEFFALSMDIEETPSIWRYYKTRKFRQLMSAFDVMTTVVQKHVSDAVVEMGQLQNARHDESVLQKLLRVNPHHAMLMVFDMLFGGIDTTTSTTANLFYILALNQEKQAILREEIFTILPQIDSTVTAERLDDAPYFRACLKETLRVQPVTASNARGTGQDLVLNGYQIPKETEVAMFHAILQTDDDYFSDSKAFVPERWLRETRGSIPPGPLAHPFAFLPFGFGVRSCVGRRFAEMQIQVLAMRLLREYRIEWHHGPMEFEHSLIVSASSPLRFRLIRSSP